MINVVKSWNMDAAVTQQHQEQMIQDQTVLVLIAVQQLNMVAVPMVTQKELIRKVHNVVVNRPNMGVVMME